jgi:hypothetical protein
MVSKSINNQSIISYDIQVSEWFFVLFNLIIGDF